MTTKVRKSVSALHAHDLDSLTKDEILALVDKQIPRGLCFVWNGVEADIPQGFALCNGLGGRTPNLVNRTVIGAGKDFPLNSTGGKYNFDLNIEGRTDGHKLTTKEVPPHTHAYESNELGASERTGWDSKNAGSRKTKAYQTSKELGNATGDSDAHDHGFSARFKHEAIGPYIVKHWIMRTGDVAPGLGESTFSSTGRTRFGARQSDLSLSDLNMLSRLQIISLIGRVFPSGICLPWWGNLANLPEGWKLLDGQEGRDDFRNRMVIGAGGNYPYGSTGGSIDVRLTKADISTATEIGRNHMPKHGHSYETQYLTGKTRKHFQMPWPFDNDNDNNRGNRRWYNTGNAETNGVKWGNEFGGVDAHSHNYTITYVHKAMTPFYALYWLQKT